MKVIYLINSSKSTAFSFEILPPLKGNSIQKVYNVIDKLIEFDPKYINITSHHREYIYKTLPDGSFQICTCNQDFFPVLKRELRWKLNHEKC